MGDICQRLCKWVGWYPTTLGRWFWCGTTCHMCGSWCRWCK